MEPRHILDLVSELNLAKKQQIKTEDTITEQDLQALKMSIIV
jgi:hypothetical protein